MKRFNKWILLLGIILPLAGMVGGCSSSSSNSGGQSAGGNCAGLGSAGTAQGTVDLALADDLNNRVVVYFDILSHSDTQGSFIVPAPTPNLVLNSATSLIDFSSSGFEGTSNNPIFLAAATGGTGVTNDLYVTNGNSDTITIYRNYLTASNNPAPSASLDSGTGLISAPSEILVDFNDNLIVANAGGNTVAIFNNASGITGTNTTAPDVVLNNAASLVNNPSGIFVALQANGSLTDLYVTNGANTAGGALVMIYRDVSTLASADVPDVRLNEDTSFFSDGSADNPVGFAVYVAHDTLFVSVEYASEINAVFVFKGASTLTTGALPNAVLFGQNTYLDQARSLVVLTQTLNGTQLLAANENASQGVCTNAPGIVGFTPTLSSATGFDDFTTGQNAQVISNQTTSQVGLAFELKQAGGALFVAGTRENCEEFPFSVIIYRNAGSLGMCSGSAPNMILPSTGIFDPTPGFGDVGNVAYWNGMAVVQR